MPSMSKTVLLTGAVVSLALSFLAGGSLRAARDMGPVGRQASLEVSGVVASTGQAQTVSETRFFYELMQLLEREYVDPISDERKLAVGSVRGMIGSLLDPHSQFMDAEQAVEHEKSLQGEFGGAGIEVRFDFDEAELKKAQEKGRPADPLLLLPELRVAMVAPGGPGEKAGLKVGDRIERVNGRWLIASAEIKALRDLQKATVEGKGDTPEADRIRSEFQAKARATMSPGRAREVLTSGAGKTVELEWSRGAEKLKGSLVTALTKVPTVQVGADGTVSLRLFKGAADALAKATKDRPITTLDLRQGSIGDSSEVKAVLAQLAPAGTYGVLANDRVGEPRTLTLPEGVSTPRPLRVLVDSSTRGAAEILALALATVPGTTLEGKTAGEPVWLDLVPLPDGSAYTLATGVFQAKGVAR